jgi:hypothetical protein
MTQTVYLRDTGWVTWVLSPAQARDFSLLHSIQTGSEAHPVSCPMDTFTEGKAVGE